MLLGSSCVSKILPWIVFKSKDSKVEVTRRKNECLRHGFGKEVWKEVSPLQEDNSGYLLCQIYRNKSGWWNSRLMKEWLQFNFGFRRCPEENPILLLVDEFSGHWTPDVLELAKRLNIIMMSVPPGYTCVAAPPDVAWNAPLKSQLRKNG